MNNSKRTVLFLVQSVVSTIGKHTFFIILFLNLFFFFFFSKHYLRFLNRTQ